MLSWLWLTVVSAAANYAAEGHLPVYLFNAQALSSAGKLIPADTVPALASYFLGDAAAAVNSGDEEVLGQFPSRFLDHRESSVLVVKDFDLDMSEGVLGSPNFYLESDSAELLKSASNPASLGNLKQHLVSGNLLLSIDALEHGLSLNQKIMNVIKEVAGATSPETKLMVIGLPGDASKLRRQSLSLLSAVEPTSYINIPDFFASQKECVSGTSNCSNKGSCVEISSGKFACKCSPTKEGDYTYYWGGNDCSKRDVSFQFNLIVGTTVAIVVAAALSITLLFNLGSQPLPGILDTSSL